ncbi:site-specific integrase [bacterium]|nr:site-specific integrase [bacterium]
MNLVEPIRSMQDIERVKRILSEKKQRDLLLFVLGINSGLRISDLLNLKISDVKNKNKVQIIEKKTGKKKIFPIIKPIKNLINNITKNKSENDWLFKSQKGEGAITRIQAYRILKQVSKIAKLSINIGTHTLRKTFGYHFYKKTKDIALLQSILNHSSPKVTLKYIGINQEIIESSLLAFCL